VILSDTEILAAMERGDIKIEPFDIAQLGGNSYDVRLGPVLRVYDVESTNNIRSTSGDWSLDCAKEIRTVDLTIPSDGMVLVPNTLYLASTLEYTETHRHVPYLDGKSGVGRMGIFVHATAGRGDVGFAGVFTLEISVVQSVRVYSGMPIGQLTYHVVHGEVERRYQTKAGASYLDGRDPMPQPSRLWRKLRRP
jgi:dCTP deaminase